MESTIYWLTKELEANKFEYDYLVPRNNREQRFVLSEEIRKTLAALFVLKNRQ